MAIDPNEFSSDGTAALGSLDGLLQAKIGGCRQGSSFHCFGNVVDTAQIKLDRAGGMVAFNHVGDESAQMISKYGECAFVELLISGELNVCHLMERRRSLSDVFKIVVSAYFPLRTKL